MILGEDVGIDGGVFRITDGLIDKFGPERVIDTPLAESAIVGAAIGMAAYGLKPVAEIQFMGFVYQAFHQISESHRPHAEPHPGPFHPVPWSYVCPMEPEFEPWNFIPRARKPFFASCRDLCGRTFHTPGCPRLMTSAIRCEDPVIFLEPKRLYRAGKQEIPKTWRRSPCARQKSRGRGTI